MQEEDKERLALILTGPMLLTGLFGGAGGWIALKGQQATGWLIEHQVLVTRDEAMIPILDAGLDSARLALIVAVAMLVLGLAVSTARRPRR